MTLDLNELNFPADLNKQISCNSELKEIILGVLKDKLLTPDQAKQLAAALVILPSFQLNYSHEVLRDLQRAGILNDNNIEAFFSLLSQSAFLSNFALILTVKKVMHPAEQAQKNFDVLCEYARTRLKGSNETIEARKKNLEDVLGLVTNIEMLTDQFQKAFQIIMEFAQAPKLIERMLADLKAIYQQNFANHLRDQQMSEGRIQTATSEVFSHIITGSPRKLNRYPKWQKTKALTMDDFNSVVHQIHVKQKIAFLAGTQEETEIKKFKDSKICDFKQLTPLIFDFFSPEVKTGKKQPRPLPETPSPDSKEYLPST